MANEGAYGSAAGMAAGAALGSVVPGVGTMIGAGLGSAAGGLIGGMFTKKPKGPNIDGELAKIAALFAQLRAQNIVNVNREAAQGRSASASNMAARGTYRSGVAQHSFNALEGERLNAIASGDAQLAGQEAGIRSNLLSQLLGLDSAERLRKQQAGAATTGAVSGIGMQLLLAALNRGQGGGEYGALPGGGFGPRYAGAIGSGNTAAYGPSANF